VKEFELRLIVLSRSKRRGLVPFKGNGVKDGGFF
jgi:hypothetical protein